MVTAPSRPLVHSYDPAKDPMELVDTPSGKMERWRADAMLVGETSALTDLIKQVHSDAAATIDDIEAREAKCAAREEACDQREKAHTVSVASFVDFIGRASVLLDRLHKAKADAIAGEEPLASPPGDPNKKPEPALELEDDTTPGTHSPSGELHAVAATKSALPPAKDEPAVTSEDQAEFPRGELPAPPVTHPQPAGLDEEA